MFPTLLAFLWSTRHGPRRAYYQSPRQSSRRQKPWRRAHRGDLCVFYTMEQDLPLRQHIFGCVRLRVGWHGPLYVSGSVPFSRTYLLIVEL